MTNKFQLQPEPVTPATEVADYIIDLIQGRSIGDCFVTGVDVGRNVIELSDGSRYAIQVDLVT